MSIKILVFTCLLASAFASVDWLLFEHKHFTQPYNYIASMSAPYTDGGNTQANIDNQRNWCRAQCMSIPNCNAVYMQRAWNWCELSQFDDKAYDLTDPNLFQECSLDFWEGHEIHLIQRFKDIVCFEGCKSCYTTENGNCFDCLPGYDFANGFCKKPCFDACSGCTGPNNGQCTGCNPGFWFQNGFCLTHCDDDYYGTKADHVCHACGHNWRGRLAVPDSWCDANCYVPTGVEVLAPACKTSSGADQRCKCFCEPKNVAASAIQSFDMDTNLKCKYNTYLDQTQPTGPVSGWGLTCVSRRKPSVTDKWCEPFCSYATGSCKVQAGLQTYCKCPS